ncbi:sigma-E processing peptidase SpoIIGA [Anaeromicrobium sediminis]|uniref:Sporulation sigma-E factor-processing peptidase n=1 Tax=Anaeromicrobium sediminis TaxID=1478221 RepID=A0A267MH21_9FIRM|nr:sigma-E processing peptidase SpoIIGA [Anaeromicrobium sediminis]PAB58836.1 sigma-E processing peptidase SpoIIGA [Anaeromicrobium sediminis]
MYEVYAEYLFLENLLMNWIILHLTAHFSKFEVRKYKIWVGAIVGALYAFVFFFPSLSFMYSMIMKIVISILIVVLTFMPYKFIDFLKLVGIFYLISFMFGGAAFALFYFTGFEGIVSNGIFYIGNFTTKLLIYSGIVSYILIKFCWEHVQEKISREKLYIPVSIEVENHKSSVKALVDTGNSLEDPLSKYPVIVVEYSAIKDLIPNDIKDMLTNNNISYDVFLKIGNDSNWNSRIRVIPFNSLGKENGMLIGFRPDMVNVEGKKHIKNIIVGIYTKRLSKNGDYSALLHPDILK